MRGWEFSQIEIETGLAWMATLGSQRLVFVEPRVLVL
jgi:hypothetical protein